MEESIDHLLLHCPFSRQIWDYFIIRLKINWMHKDRGKEQLEVWTDNKGKKMGRKIWPIIPATVLWALWSERNKVMAKKRSSRDEHTLICEVKKLVFQWGSIQNWFSVTTFRDLISSTPTGTTAPCKSSISAFVSASYIKFKE